MSAVLDETARTKKLDAARDLIRSATLADSTELFAFVNTLIAACEFRSDATDILIEAACDIENLDTPPSSLSEMPYSGRERGELDSMTAGVRHRG
jgi:hypothetical protein